MVLKNELFGSEMLNKISTLRQLKPSQISEIKTTSNTNINLGHIRCLKDVKLRGR